MTDLTLESSEGYKFLFQVVSPSSNSKIQPSMAIPLPNTSSKNQLLFRFMGQQEEVSFDFVLVDSTTDLSDGTAPSGDFPFGVLSVIQQQIFLRDYLYGFKYDTGFYLTFGAHYNDYITGNIENMTFDAPPSSGFRFRTGKITFKRGRTAQGTN
jgi:hypothetical protein